MKSIAILFLLMPILGLSQNLVPNPSFEEYDMCPTEFGQTERASYWHSALESPDYFNACSPSSDVNNIAIDVPINGMGFQEAATGSAYLGLFSFFIVDDYREYVQCELISPMQAGTTYYFSMKCSRAEGYGFPYDHFNLASNNLGVLFSTQEYLASSNPLIANNYAHINFEQVVLDTNNWITFNGQFVADQSYAYMSLGNFFDSTMTDIVGTDASAIEYPYGSYYLIDDICLSENPFCSLFDDIENIIPDFEYSIHEGQLNIINQNQLYLQIYSCLGELIYDSILQPHNSSRDLSAFETGLYLIVFQDELKRNILINKIFIQ